MCNSVADDNYSDSVATAIAVGATISFGIAVALCIYFLIRCHRKRKYHANRRVVFIDGVRSTRGIYTRAATATNDDATTCDEAPPAYIPDNGYQPCPAEAPPTAKDPDQ